jgi:hypothetical protein
MQPALNLVLAVLIMIDPIQPKGEVQDPEGAKTSRHRIRGGVIDLRGGTCAGIEVEPLTFQLGRYFEVEGGTGVVLAKGDSVEITVPR